jgi:hypothetical protein
MTTVQRRKVPNKAPARPPCGVPVHQSVDLGVMRHINLCNGLLAECYNWLRNAQGGDDTAEAQRVILLNLGRCLSEATYGMVTLLNHDATGAILVLERAAIEYYGRASYFMREPEHALWYVKVEHLQVLIENEATTPEQRKALIHEISHARRKYAELTPEARTAANKQPFNKVRISDMIRIGLGEEAAKRYASASKVLHGDLYSSFLLVSRAPEAVNGAVLEAASGIVAFCNLMLTWLPRAPNGLTERILDAEDETVRLGKRYGRAFLLEAVG